MLDRSTPWKVAVSPPRKNDGGNWALRAKRRRADGSVEEHRVSIGEQARAEAERLPWEVDLNSGTPVARASLPTLMDQRIADLEREARAGVKSHESVANFRTARKRLAGVLGEVPAVELDTPALLRARAKLLDDGAGPESCNTYFRRAAACWSWSKTNGLIDRPWPGLKPFPKGPGKKRPLTPAEVADILEWVRVNEPWWYPAFRLVDDTGRRSSEVGKLKGKDLNRATREVRVRQKGGSVLVLPIRAEVLELLPVVGPEEWLFARKKIARTGGGMGPARRDSMRKVLKRAVEAIGIPDAERLDMHSFRRATASHGHRAGLPNDTLRRLTGHETAAMLEHYQRETVGDDLRAAQEQLHAWRRQGTTVPALSPNPTVEVVPGKAKAPARPGLRVGVSGFEPETSSLSGRGRDRVERSRPEASGESLGDTIAVNSPNSSKTVLSIRGTLSPGQRACLRPVSDLIEADPLEALELAHGISEAALARIRLLAQAESTRAASRNSS